MVAQEAARNGVVKDPAHTVVDPPIGWFNEWIAEYLDAIRQGGNIWLAVDIETAEKAGQDEAEVEDWTGEILRINFSCNPNEGITVPFGGQYAEGIRALLSATGVKVLWNARFDTARLRSVGLPVSEPALDFMWAWHILQSDTPRGLGYVAPFYSRYGPWKHLSGSSPGEYAAIDAFQTLRVAYGIAKDLERQGQWTTFLRHVWELDAKVLRPAEELGLLVDKVKLDAFKADLETKTAVLHGEIQGLVPDSLKPVKLWKRAPDDNLGAVPERRREVVQVCTACGASEVAKSHRCADRTKQPSVNLHDADVTRWVKTLDFNPSSPDQIRLYAAHRGHPLGRAKHSKTGRGSTDRKTLQALKKGTRDPLYGKLLDHREIGKVLGTYVDGSLRRLGGDGRLHPSFLHKPSTLRLSCVNPNLQNVVSDRAGPEALASGFRSCLVAAPGCVLIEADFAGIEAVETGWFSGDPDYIRLAKLGVHAYLASHLVGQPAALKWSDKDLGEHFKLIKDRFKGDYDRAKRCVHGSNYGLTPIGMVNNYPEIFTRASAQKTQSIYFEVCPKLGPWQKSVRDRAFKQHYLGGDEHPFKYKHWFWSVYVYNQASQSWKPGEDSKRVVAYFPQSTSAGVIKEASLRLMAPGTPSYIGDLYYGQTPVRALVHDSILVEVPKTKQDECIERMVTEMTRAIPEQPCPAGWNMGAQLSIGVSVKTGTDWLAMSEVNLGQLGVAADTAVRAAEEEEVEA